MLRYRADIQTLLWACLFAPALVAIQLARPSLAPYLCVVSCYLALACGVIAHNHNHCPTFKAKWANRWFGNWISIFYGYPTFAWIPTHNLNHHKLVNKEGDATITWRYTNKHTFLVALTYFFVSAYFQSDPIKDFIRKARKDSPVLFWRIILQYVIVYGTAAALIALSVSLHGWKTGLTTWALACGIPGFFALWAIMLFNYEQHVHCDAFSEYNHSRNFVGGPLNFLLFNNGYHAAHHQTAGVHWSELRALHEKLEPHIDPQLLVSNCWVYWFKQYALRPFMPSVGSVQIGRAPFEDQLSDELLEQTAR